MWPHWRLGSDSGALSPQSQCVACQVVTGIPRENVSLGGDQTPGGAAKAPKEVMFAQKLVQEGQGPAAGLWDSVLSRGPQSAETLGGPRGA